MSKHIEEALSTYQPTDAAIEREKMEKAVAEGIRRREAMRPHVEKLHAYAESLRELPLPEGLPKEMAQEVYRVVEDAYLEILDRWPAPEEAPA